MKRKWIMVGLGGAFIGIGINLFILPSHIINNQFAVKVPTGI
ncbi:hypothetical protein [Priestia aryabhattai]